MRAGVAPHAVVGIDDAVLPVRGDRANPSGAQSICAMSIDGETSLNGDDNDEVQRLADILARVAGDFSPFEELHGFSIDVSTSPRERSQRGGATARSRCRTPIPRRPAVSRSSPAGVWTKRIYALRRRAPFARRTASSCVTSSRRALSTERSSRLGSARCPRVMAQPPRTQFVDCSLCEPTATRSARHRHLGHAQVDARDPGGRGVQAFV